MEYDEHYFLTPFRILEVKLSINSHIACTYVLTPKQKQTLDYEMHNIAQSTLKLEAMLTGRESGI